ncbi:hypothetical protein TW86_04015 [Halomonas sp. S2151]|uniref:putative 2OG-Fe(II) oxygenase n=1 Tax=Halomonas sp. S2151 TaxID=579478 RepID=UPI0005FA7EB9|nr:putative 2OG-Fe(II) oxygenase [Halomonas sp. S2151]KJZ17426.1 hypothetical protein TW86_04015 [Halomonas sp. S2151]
MSEFTGFNGLIGIYDIDDFTATEWETVVGLCNKMAQSEGVAQQLTAGNTRADVIGDTPELQRISSALEEAIGHYLVANFPVVLHPDTELDLARVGSWFSVYRKGESQATHTHDADLSALIYFDTVEEDHGGLTIFTNPVNPHLPVGSGLMQKGLRVHLPVEAVKGRIVVFPSYLEHGCSTYEGPGLRRVLAADFTAQ